MGETLNSTEILHRRLQEANAEELKILLVAEAAELDLVGARHVLANPFVGKEAIEILLGQPRLVATYELRRALAGHPRTPQAAALDLVPTLFWRDLAELTVSMQTAPAVRHLAERHLLERLPVLTEGERIALARRAVGGVLQRLRHDGSQRVVAALLENPRLTEGLLMPLVASESALPEVLRLVATSRWGLRYEVRVGLVRNRRTPGPIALSLVAQLRRAELAAVAADPRLALPLRRAARDRLTGAAGRD
ncbi:MAG TPA: hypothetical protein VF017_13485 [Thermoanaerobaculia bacterium]|nr:hypothetical protein [Thermoanaerobaculia bacterium]